MSRAIIVGHTGQDGCILWDQLVANGDSLVGISRQSVRAHNVHWGDAIDISDPEAVRRLVISLQPDQIYYLAAHHHSSEQGAGGEVALWNESRTVHIDGLLHFLDAVSGHHPSTRIFYASSSRVFGNARASPQDERTPFKPTCMYGVTKAAGMMLADFYRQTHGVFVSCGILFNHESSLRRPEFVSQRIINGLIQLRTGRACSLRLGDLSARVDWGYAPDYTRAMQLILSTDTPNDFVVASGETHSVREMLDAVASVLGMSWEGYVLEDDNLLRRNSQDLCGDASRLRRVTGWEPSTTFQEMVRCMVEAALESRIDVSTL